jgi:trans-2,3-dihydro-3-hydroxyanthranilate isomerase
LTILHPISSGSGETRSDLPFSLAYAIVDVFAEQKYAGNPLAVFQDRVGLSQAQMQQIAREINYSETTFIQCDRAVPSDESASPGSTYRVRIFSPMEELPFAGHPTLGTAFVIQQLLIGQPVPDLRLQLNVGEIPVRIDYKDNQPDILWMQQNQPTFGDCFEVEPIAAVLNLEPSDIDDRSPIQSVSTGLPFILVPLRTLAALQKMRLNRDRYEALIAHTEAKALFMFCPETRDPTHHLSARMFADALGIPEDPATGSANGCLAAYLIQYCQQFSQFQTGSADRVAIDLRVEQGYEIHRPSLLFLRAAATPEAIVIHVGGQVVWVARGEFI